MARGSLYVAVILLLATSCSKTVERIEIVPVPLDSDVPGSARASTYEATLTLVLDGLERELALPRVDVSLVLFPNRRTFEQGLLRIGYTPALARSASSFNAIGGARAVLMNAASTDGLTRASRIRLIAHEVVHTLQYRLSGGTRGASEQWLREGFAEWVACRVTARAGLGSFDSLRGELIDQLADVDLGRPHAPFEKLATFPQWVDAQRRYQVPLYAQAFIAAELLVEMRGAPAVVQYFERFRNTQDRRAAFAAAFGLEPAGFELAFVRRWRETVSRAAAQR